jgi:hypothetical protein
MKLTRMTGREGFGVSFETRFSFASAPEYCRIAGPGRLVRLLQMERFNREGALVRESALAGQFWFDEMTFISMRMGARAEIAAQARSGKNAFINSQETLAALHAKFSLREDLAISKDWTTEFDAYAVLPLDQRDSLVALVGRVMSQPYYQRAPAGTLSPAELPGMQKQYVIDFTFPANRAFAARIQGPHPF